ncbi:MAG: hypothetical protein VW618_11155 [Alphaproteobacteria bacterium]
MSTSTEDDEEATSDDAEVDDGKVGAGTGDGDGNCDGTLAVCAASGDKGTGRETAGAGTGPAVVTLPNVGAGCAGGGVTTIWDGVAFGAEAGVEADAACGASAGRALPCSRIASSV